jgi:hypothetical protein
MKHRHSPVLILAAATLLAACGAEAGKPEQPRASARPAVLPSSRVVELRLYGAFRAGLRSLSIATAAGGESGDIGQPVPTGVVDRVSCASARRCLVRWRDVDGHAQRTSYVVLPAARGCFDAIARPGLAAILDPSEGAMFTHPLEELGEGREPC